MIELNQLKLLYCYCKETGRLINRKTNKSIGRKAHRGSISYYRVTIKKKDYYLHQLAWLYHHGYFPNEIDHINGNGLDNRICNLRNVQHGENMRNLKKNKRNTSGVTGVYFSKARATWNAYISVNGTQIPLGCFKRKEDAVNARKKGDNYYGFHENHGKR